MVSATPAERIHIAIIAERLNAGSSLECSGQWADEIERQDAQGITAEIVVRLQTQWLVAEAK